MGGHSSQFQGSREINEMTMYQHLDMDQPPRENHETGREDEEFATKMSHRYRTGNDQVNYQKSDFQNNNLIEHENYTYDPKEQGKPAHDLYNNRPRPLPKQ